MTNIKSIISIFMVIVLLFVSAGSLRAQEEEIDIESVSSQQALVINVSNNMVLFDRNASEPVFCGYLPRIMTCILLLELDKDLNTEVTITKDVLKNTPQPSALDFKVGDVVTLETLVLAALMANAQDACVAIALSISSDLDTFIGLMNKKAKELGAEHTTFTNVHGYYTNQNVNMTTLYDAAKILHYATTLKDFEKYANTTYTTVKVNGLDKQLYTRIGFIVEQGSTYYIPDAKGLGIFSDSRSGAGLAGEVTTKNMTVLILAQTNGALSALYADAKTMVDYAKNDYITRTLTTAGTAIRELKVKQGKDKDYVVLVAEKDVNALMSKTIPEDKIEVIINVPEQVNAPIEKNAVLGTISYVYGGYTYGTVNLLAKTSVELDRMQAFTDILDTIFKSPIFLITITIIILLVLIYTIIAIYINRRRQKKKKSSKHERIKIDIE